MGADNALRLCGARKLHDFLVGQVTGVHNRQIYALQELHLVPVEARVPGEGACDAGIAEAQPVVVHWRQVNERERQVPERDKAVTHFVEAYLKLGFGELFGAEQS